VAEESEVKDAAEDSPNWPQQVEHESLDDMEYKGLYRRSGSAVFSLMSTGSMSDMSLMHSGNDNNSDDQSKGSSSSDPWIMETPSVIDGVLAVTQDSVKTVITQSFSGVAYVTDSLASLLLRAHKYADERAGPVPEQSTGTASSEHEENQSPEDAQAESEIDSIAAGRQAQMVERAKVMAEEADSSKDQDQAGQRHAEEQGLRAIPPLRRQHIGNVSSEAFSELFHDLGNRDPEQAPFRRLPSDGALASLNISDSEGDLSKLSYLNDNCSQAPSSMERADAPWKAVLTRPLKLASSMLGGEARDEDETMSPLSGVTHFPLSPASHYGLDRAPSFQGLRNSLSRVSLSSLNSVKDSLSTWRSGTHSVPVGGPPPSSWNTESGLFEDLELFLLERVDLTFFAVRDLVMRLRRGKRAKREEVAWRDTSRPPGQSIKGSPSSSILSKLMRAKTAVIHSIPNPISLLKGGTRRMVHLDNVDELKGVGKIVRRQGYPYQEIFVCTRDGYILALERLPNPGSKKVLYLQHGVMDSSFTWVANGADASVAYRAHEEGYDVFLGNFRGTGGAGAHRHVDPTISPDRYWDFSINEHAFEDVRAFMQAIVKVKKEEEEGIGEEKPSIISIAHSMGGAALIMYVINARQKNEPHYLDGMVLVSPAGIHVDSPLYARAGGRMVDLTVARMVDSLRLPNDFLTRATVKLVHDIKQKVPALEDIISLVIVYSIGGDKNQPRNGPFSTVQQLTYNVLTCGTSTKAYAHLRQFITSKRFRAFDYDSSASPNFRAEPGGNMKHYGTPEPPEYTDLYHMIDIPVHLIAGRGDKLIGPTNVLLHHDYMKAQGVDVTIESLEHCGHADFTCGLHHGALTGILEATQQVHGRAMFRQQEIKQLRRKKLITPHFSSSASSSQPSSLDSSSDTT